MFNRFTTVFHTCRPGSAVLWKLKSLDAKKFHVRFSILAVAIGYVLYDLWCKSPVSIDCGTKSKFSAAAFGNKRLDETSRPYLTRN